MEIDYDKLWQEVYGIDSNISNTEYQKPHEKAISQIAKEIGCSEGATRDMIKRLISLGKMGSRVARYDRGLRTVYWPIASEGRDT